MQPSPPSVDPRIRRARALAQLLDSALRIPGTRIRFGLDPILGLLPGLGDALAALLGGYLLWTALRSGAPWPVLLRMFANLSIDALVGAVPLAGTLFDVAFKAHQRNARLLSDWADSPQAIVRRERGRLLAWVLVLLALLLLVMATLAFGLWALWRLLSFGIG